MLPFLPQAYAVPIFFSRHVDVALRCVAFLLLPAPGVPLQRYVTPKSGQLSRTAWLIFFAHVTTEGILTKLFFLCCVHGTFMS